MNPKIIQSKDELNKLIATIATAGKRLDGQIQIAGASALFHLASHGDVGFVNRLFTSVAKGTRKSALTSWFLAHGALVANTEGNKAEKPFNYTKDKDTNVEAALADPWFSHKPDANPDEVFDLQKAVMALIKRAQGKTLVHAEMLTALQAMVTPEDPAGDADTEGQPAGETVPAAQ